MTSITIRARHLLLACAAAPALAGPAPAADAAAQAYDLQPQSLEAALRAVALKSGRAILAPSRLLAGRQAPPLKGEYTPAAAFRALLAGSGLELAQVGEDFIVRDPRERPESPVSAADQPGAASTVAEVMVTGTRLRGAEVAAPVDVITRTDIDRTGYADVGEVIRSLPEAFGGGQNPGVAPGATAGSAGNQNTDNASTVNLRGLGSDATLVLIDGQRLSADGGFGASDISVIPLQAIARIDVVTDGASALYGADAVAGVVNFILRKDVQGAQLSATLGDPTRGGGFDQTYSALAGGVWGSGHALASLEYNHQDPITAGERDITAGAAPINPLLQGQNRLSLFTNAGADLGAWASLDVDALYSQRQTGEAFEYSRAGPAYTYVETDRSYFLAPRLDVSLPGAWTASLSGTASGSRNSEALIYRGGENDAVTTNSLNGVELSANGAGFSLPSGPVKLALGGGYLAEGYDYTDSLSAPEKAQREVGYVFAEAAVPLVRPDDGRTGLNRLDLTLAGRLEHYSDFGGAFSPKAGLRYQPVPGLALRATWGQSFKAPQFGQEVVPDSTYLFPAVALGGASGQALIEYGGNTRLKAERASAWTAGVDWSPPQVRAMTVSLTYFNIDYTNRIILPFLTPVGALSNPAYAPFIITDPTAAQQAAAIATAPTLLNETGQAYDPAQVVALLEGHYINATAQKIDGVDLSIKKGFVLPLGTLDAFAGASWLRITQQLVAGAPSQTVTGTLFNPPTAKVRSGLTWAYGGFTSTGVLNWIAGERDNGVSPAVPVSAWTTVDLTLSYRFGRPTPALPGLEAALSVTNLFDRDPPFARGAGVQYAGYDFDSTNASAIGRFISLTLRQRF